MGTIIIQEDTTKNPISLIGKEAGVCWGADTSNSEKNYKRGIDCIKSNHGRTLEFPQIYMIVDGYSIRFGRELYTHIGGSPSRLQSSTRYIDYNKNGFSYVVPPSIACSLEKESRFKEAINSILDACVDLEKMGVPREDYAMLIPLAATSTIVLRTNLRHIIDMSKQRMCSRAFWEFRNFMNDMLAALSDYSPEWKELIDMGLFHPKCVDLGYCPEKKGCGRYESKDNNN